MALLKLSSPWVIFYRELNAMFEQDPEIKVIFDEEENVVTLYVDNATKAEALQLLIPEEKNFGNVKLKIDIIPANDVATLTPYDYEHAFDTAFKGNGAFCFSDTIYGIMSNPITYVVFENRVVQYFNDSLSDIHGLCSTLYQEIAKDIFNPLPGVYYCTNKPSIFYPKAYYKDMLKEAK